MQYVLVTGASTGIGYETTSHLIKKGIQVLASVRTEKDAKKLSDVFGENVTPLLFDVTNREAIQVAYLKAKKKIGSDVFLGIVNNAGIVVNGPLIHVDIDQVRVQLDVNVLGPLHVIQTFFPLLKRKEENLEGKKKIIQMGSISGLFASPFVGPYCASKYALEAINDSLRRELLIYDHLEVCMIEPGAIKTPIWAKAKSEDESLYLNTDYAHILANKNKIIESTENNAIESSAVAEAVYKCFSKDKPPLRQIVMKKKWMFNLIRKWVPARVTDQQIQKNLIKGTNYRNI